MSPTVWQCTIHWCALLGALMSVSSALVGQPTLPSPWVSEPAIPIGSWRTHFSYRTIQHLAITPERIYGAAANGLLYISRADNSLGLLSKNDGLGDVSVVAFAYEPSRNALMIAYQSGRIDVLIGHQVIPFTLIQEANQDQREIIHSIHWQQSTAFVSTSQGVRVLTVSEDPNPTVRIRESYTQLSATGTPLAVFDAVTSADSLFLATEAGVIANALTPAANRQDFSTWHRFGPTDGLPPGEVRYVTHRAGVTYAAFDRSGVFSYLSETWQPTPLVTTQSFHSLRATASGLIATFGDQVVLLNEQGDITMISDALISIPQDAAIDEQGAVWIADQNNGLLRGEGGTFTAYLPHGPTSDNLSGVRFVNRQIIALDATAPGTFSMFVEGQWSAFRAPSVTTRLSDVVFSPTARAYYLSTLGNGLVQWDGQQQFVIVPPPEGSAANDRLTSLALQDEQVWVGRFSTSSSLLAYSPAQNTWRNFPMVPLESTYPRQLVVDFSGYKWILTGDSSASYPPGNNLLVFDEQENQLQTVRSNIRAADLPGDQITDLVVDQDGLVWIGGNQGIAYFPDPFGIFSEVVVVKPVFDRQYLLPDEYVTDISVDGSNRKWIGTRNGLWLFSDTGEALIHHFTTDNSPLISNTILDITINDADGEVFILTDRGLVSYRGTATQATATHQSVKVFPNPIRSGFDGTVGIQGLAPDATVKITSISGTLVQELQAEGGTATWDTRNYAGQRVSPGVYLLFSATAGGEETYVGKMAVVP